VTTANEKGVLLEEGVRFIEEHILRAESQVKDSDLAIETRKIIMRHGVRHEIDLYVRINGARSYDAVFIFECKNWQEKVGKNEIVVVSEKIRVTAAQRGGASLRRGLLKTLWHRRRSTLGSSWSWRRRRNSQRL
jgi:hypothetical protein